MTEKAQRLKEIVERIDEAMFVTKARNGSLRARPMAIAEIEDDGTLWFVTALDSEKIEEVGNDSVSAVVGQKDGTFLSISGLTEIIWDRDRIDAIWRPGFDRWFEKGKDDPRAAALRFVPVRAEYWDRSGLKPWLHVFDTVVASFPGQKLEGDEIQDHEKVKL